MLREVNRMFITLIPKVENPEMVSQFRPIGLCNTMYMIISKCLVRRVKWIMSSLVREFQGAFVPGRSISDNILIGINSLIGYRKREQE